MLLSRARLGLAVSLLVLNMTAGASPATWQDTPSTLQLAPVGDTLRLNGTPMHVRAFRSPLPLDKLVQEVEENWQRANRSAVTRSVLPGWTVLNQTVGDDHRSFQVRPSGPGHVEGFVALTSPKLTREPKLAVRLPSDMTAISIVDSVDQGRTSQQVIAVSPRSMDSSASAIESQLRAGGWERHVFKKNGGSIIFAANKGEQQFDATVSMQKNGALIMISVLTK